MLTKLYLVVIIQCDEIQCDETDEVTMSRQSKNDSRLRTMSRQSQIDSRLRTMSRQSKNDSGLRVLETRGNRVPAGPYLVDRATRRVYSVFKLYEDKNNAFVRGALPVAGTKRFTWFNRDDVRSYRRAHTRTHKNTHKKAHH